MGIRWMKKQQLWTPKNCAWHLEKLITDQMNGSLLSVNRKIVFVFRDLEMRKLMLSNK